MASVILVPTLSLGNAALSTTEVFTVDEVWSEVAAFYFKKFFIENQSVFEYLHGEWQKVVMESGCNLGRSLSRSQSKFFYSKQ